MKQVAIIGGGPGGLMTAYLLDQKTTDNLGITLFEASDRVGGKIVTMRFDSAPVSYEAGAAELYGYSQVGPDPLRRLVETLGLSTVKMFGETVVLGDRIMRNPTDIKRHFGAQTLKAINKFRKRGISLMSPEEYYDSGWPDDNKHVWAERSFQSVLAKVPDEAARRYLKVAVHSDLACEPHQTSGLFGLQNALIDDQRYVRLYSIEEGLERLPRALKESISAHVELNRPVLRVEKARANSHRVYCSRNDGHTVAYEFDLVVVALPAGWIPTIEWGGRRLEAAMREHHAYYDDPAHYLRIVILFQKPFWRPLITDSYFQLDAFGGCCVYDEGSKFNAGSYGVLSWLLAGHGALLESNHDNQVLIEKALASLPRALAAGRELFLEGRVHRWIGTVTAHRVGHPIKGPKSRHLPEPREHPGLIVVGDYLFDSTINGVLDSADIGTDLALLHLGIRKRPKGAAERTNKAAGTLKKSYFDYYDGKKSYKKAFKEYFDEDYIIKLLHAVWGLSPPYRLLDAGSANGLSLKALAKVGVDAWGIENNAYIYKKTPQKLRLRNLLGNVCSIPFDNQFFDFVYETCLCYVPPSEVDHAIQELYRVTRHGVFFGSIVRDNDRHALKERDLFCGVQTLWSLQEWSERFLRNGFRLAAGDPQTLTKVWKVENMVNGGVPWYPTREIMKYCFYTKLPKALDNT